MPDVGDTVTLAIEWRVNGVLTNDATTAVSVLRPDGSTATPTVSNPSVGRYTAPLPLTLLGSYSGAWAATTLAQTEEFAISATSNPRYFGLGELRALPGMAVATYSDEQLSAARDWIEAIVERACETSFVAKPVTELRSGSGREELFLSTPFPRAVTACAVDGTALTAPELALCVIDRGAVSRRTATGSVSWVPWASGTRNISISYTAGYSDVPPDDLKEAMLAAARTHVLESRGSSGIPARALSMSTEQGNINYSVASKDRPTGLPDADAVILGWAETTAVFGFA